MRAVTLVAALQPSTHQKEPAVPVLPATWLDVFADAPLHGTLHLVVHDADGLDDAVIRAFSRRTRLPETSFVQKPTTEGASYRHRIFVPGTEVPFAGHPSLGTAIAIAFRQGSAAGQFVQETLSGQQPIEFQLSGTIGRAAIRQNSPEFGLTFAGGETMALAGLPAEAAHPILEPQWINTGMPTLIVPIGSAADLARVRFDWLAFRSRLAGWGPAAAYNCYVCAELGPGHWAARCFGENPETGEDPATGSAAGPLGAYLQARLGWNRVVVEQGREIGSPSRLEVDMTGGIVVSGGVRIIGTGTLELPSSHAEG
jgi:trans-2,3-dihydro-3-hydroxyanthranilate isomerase